MHVCVRTKSASDVCCLQVIFRDGEGALQVLPQLVGVIPEARLNLVVYHLRQGVCHRHEQVLLWACHCGRGGWVTTAGCEWYIHTRRRCVIVGGVIACLCC